MRTPQPQPYPLSTMPTALPNNRPQLGAHINGVVKAVQVVEKRRLREVRKRAFAQHGDPSSWRNLHGVPFNGGLSHFQTLSPYTRSRIEREVVRDLREHMEEWRGSPVCSVVEDRPEVSNLFLDQGKDAIVGGTIYIAGASLYAAIGTGTTPPTVSDSTLGSEVKRTATYLTGAGNCGSSWGSYYQTGRRTYDFTEETSNMNYSELGFASASSGGMCSRLLISGGTVSVLVGQALRVVYDLTTTFGSITGSGVLNIGEWGAVSENWFIGDPGLSYVHTDGSIKNTGGTRSPFEPIQRPCYCNAVSGDFTLGFGGSLSGATGLAPQLEGVWGSYATGTFTRNLTWPTYWSAASWASTAIRGFEYYNAVSFFAVKFSTTQTKTNLQKLKPCGLTLTYT